MELTPEPQGIESRYGCVVQMRGSATPGRLQGRSVQFINQHIKNSFEGSGLAPFKTIHLRHRDIIQHVLARALQNKTCGTYKLTRYQMLCIEIEIYTTESFS